MYCYTTAVYEKGDRHRVISFSTVALVCCFFSSCAGALIYLLNLFCNSQNPTVREETASLFAKMITDKLVGPKVRIVLMKFLPVIFMDAMRDSPEASVHMFESTSDSVAVAWY